MSKTQISLSLLFSVFLAQSAWASTVWLKDRNGDVCTNSLSSNPGKVIGYGGHDGGGNFTMTISNPSDGVLTPATGDCFNLPLTGASATPSPIVFNGPVSIFRSRVVNQIGQGTEISPGVYATECLEHGSNTTGLNNWPTPLTNGAFLLRFSHTSTNGCVAGTTPPQLITVDGMATYVRNARVDGGPRVFFGTYYIFDTNAIPEPDSLTLLLAGGVAGLFLTRAWRRRSRTSSHG
jgi:hypothetical protein